MAWIFLQELEGSRSRSEKSPDQLPIVRLSRKFKPFLCRECQRMNYIPRRSGMTSEPYLSMCCRKQLISSTGDSRANLGVVLREGETRQTACIRNLRELLTNASPPFYSLKIQRRKRFGHWPISYRVTRPRFSSLMLPPWALRTLGDDLGYLATPTRTANQLSPAMSKWPGCRRMQKLFGHTIRPTVFEWLMGYRLGWTRLEPWAMQWLRSTLEQRSISSAG